MKAEVSFEAYLEAEKLELVYGQILEVEEIPKSNKLYKLTVNFGEEIGNKTICSSIKEYISSENLVMNCYFFIVNFAPRKIMGVLSEGMIVPFSIPSLELKDSLRYKVPTGPVALPLGTKLF